MTVTDWIRIDGECYGTKKVREFVSFDDEGKKFTYTGKVTITIHKMNGRYWVIRQNRYHAMEKVLFWTMAKAKIYMLKYMRDNSF